MQIFQLLEIGITLFFILAVIGLPLLVILIWKSLKKTKTWKKVLLLLIFTVLYLFIVYVTYIIGTNLIGLNPNNPSYTGPGEHSMVPNF